MKNLIQIYPEVAESFFDLTKSIRYNSIHSSKLNELILIGTFASHNYTKGLETHINRALNLDATEDEIFSSIILGLPVVGIVNINSSLDKAKEVIDSYEKL